MEVSLMNVNVQFREDGNVLRGYIEGEIDTFTAPVLREELETVSIIEGRLIELDLSKVNYMDSTGLGIFVAFYKKVSREDASLKLVGLSNRLVRLFEITGLSELMSIETDEELELK
jgi:anti-sigma B factor antagonist